MPLESAECDLESTMVVLSPTSLTLEEWDRLEVFRVVPGLHYEINDDSIPVHTQGMLSSVIPGLVAPASSLHRERDEAFVLMEHSEEHMLKRNLLEWLAAKEVVRCVRPSDGVSSAWVMEGKGLDTLRTSQVLKSNERLFDVPRAQKAQDATVVHLHRMLRLQGWACSIAVFRVKPHTVGEPKIWWLKKEVHEFQRMVF